MRLPTNRRTSSSLSQAFYNQSLSACSLAEGDIYFDFPFSNSHDSISARTLVQTWSRSKAFSFFSLRLQSMLLNSKNGQHRRAPRGMSQQSSRYWPYLAQQRAPFALRISTPLLLRTIVSTVTSTQSSTITPPPTTTTTSTTTTSTDTSTTVFTTSPTTAYLLIPSPTPGPAKLRFMRRGFPNTSKNLHALQSKLASCAKTLVSEGCSCYITTYGSTIRTTTTVKKLLTTLPPSTITSISQATSVTTTTTTTTNTPPTPTATFAQVRNQPGCIYNEYSHAYVETGDTVADVDDCASHCANDPDCNSFAYYHDTQTGEMSCFTNNDDYDPTQEQCGFGTGAYYVYERDV